MSVRDELNRIGQEKLREFRAMLDELEVQMNLGKREAKDLLVREKETLSKFMEDQRQGFEKAFAATETQRAEFAEKMRAVHAKLQEVPVDADAWKAWKGEVLDAVHELEYALKNTYKNFGPDMQNSLDNLKPHLDSFRLELAMAKEGMLDGFREALNEALEHSVERLDRDLSLGDRFDKFSDNMGQSFEHMKKAFGELFN